MILLDSTIVLGFEAGGGGAHLDRGGLADPSVVE